MNTFNSEFFELLLVLTSIILKLNCTYHTSDHAASRDSKTRHLKSADLKLKWRQFLVL